MENRAMFVLLLLLQGCVSAWSACSGLDTVLAAYDRDTSPSIDAPVPVSVALEPRHATLNDKDATIRLLADLHMKWSDERLSWNATELGNAWCAVSPELIWKPRVGPFNARSEVNNGDQLKANVSANGDIKFSAHYDLIFAVTLHLESWPFDTQTTSVLFSTEEDPETVDLQFIETATAVPFDSTWSITNFTSWSFKREEYQFLAWTLSLRRHALAHAVATTALLVTVIMLLAAASMMPVTTRPQMCACAALITCIWLVSMALRLPSAAHAPHCVTLMCFLCGCAVVMCLSAATVACVARLTKPAPDWIRRVVRSSTASFILKMHMVETSDSSESPTANAWWRALARLIDCVILDLVSIVTLVLTAIYTATLAG